MSFPNLDVNVIALTDSVDFTSENDSLLVGFHALINEAYAQDISKKCRASKQARAASGAPLGRAPYGYIKNPDGPTTAPNGEKKDYWIIDPVAARTVRRIFDLCISGHGVAEIAGILEREEIAPPSTHAKRNGRECPCKKNWDEMHWVDGMVRHILTNRSYTGCVINMKTQKKGFKSKKVVKLPPEKWLVFPNVNTPIVDELTFDTAQKHLEQQKGRRIPAKKEKNPFSGVLVCSTCGSKLNFHKNSVSGISYFNCPKANRDRKYCTLHYIRYDQLNEIVCDRIRKLAQSASKDSEGFREQVLNAATRKGKAHRRQLENVLADLQGQLHKVETMLVAAFEKNVEGTLADEAYSLVTAKYTAQQESITRQIADVNAELEQELSMLDEADVFTAAMSKYTRLKKVTKRILNELVDRIVIYESETVDGKKIQRIDIHFHCIGAASLPLEKEVTQKTFSPRAGVLQTVQANA